MFDSSVKLLLQFEDDSLQDTISGTNFVVEGTDTDIEVLSNGAGYWMKQDQYLYHHSLSLSITTDVTFGFWLYPVNAGLTRDQTTSVVTDLQMPLITLRWNDTNVFEIYEFTEDNNYNYITFSIVGSTYKASSESYAIGLWHYVWITYNGSSVSIHIDGTPQTLQNVSGILPASVTGSSLDMYINKNFTGTAFNKTNNYGIIDDVVIFNETKSELDLQRIINYNINYFDIQYINQYEKNYGIYMDDPSVLRVNSMVYDMSYIFLGRDDGKIMRGSPLFWEARKILSDEKELALFRENLVGDESKVAEAKIEDGFLNITNSIVRF